MGECLTLQQNWFGIWKWDTYVKNKYLMYESEWTFKLNLQRQCDGDSLSVMMGECLTLQQNWFGIRKWDTYMKNKYLMYESEWTFELSLQRQCEGDNLRARMGKYLTLQKNWFGIRKWDTYMENKYLVYERPYLSFDVIEIKKMFHYIPFNIFYLIRTICLNIHWNRRELQQDKNILNC